jgi:hypothetical protein
MRLAYLILAHNTPRHLRRLIRALKSPDAAFLIHVDGRSDIEPFRCGGFDHNVAFLENRFDVYWDDFSKVDATIRLIRHAVNQYREPDYLVLLSGCDYPLRSPGYIENFFRKNQGHQFMNSVPLPCDALGKPLARLEHYWLPTPYRSQFVVRAVARLNAVNNRLELVTRDYARVFKGLRPFGGSTWWALTRQACQYILSFIDSRPEIVTFFRNTYMPDESFFQTIIGNSAFSADRVRNLTFADWSRPNGGPGMIDMDHLKMFTGSDRIVADDGYGKGELLFARKFGDNDSELTKLIDEQLIRRG